MKPTQRLVLCEPVPRGGSPLQTSGQNADVQSVPLNPLGGGVRTTAFDDELHTVLVRMAADVPAYTQYGDLVQAMVEQAVYDASFVYEQQLNVELVIDDLLIYTDAATAPDWAKDCSTGTYDEFMDYKFAN
eukprot:316695-Amphidinium_carterae.1